jgi:hypothetical protein
MSENRVLAKPMLSSVGTLEIRSKSMKFGPFPFWFISPFAGVQLGTCYLVLNPSGLPALAIQLSC